MQNYFEQSEIELQKQVIKALLLSGYLVIRFNSGAKRVGKRFINNYLIYNNKSKSGLADLQAIKKGRCLFLEIKQKKGKTSSSQIEFSHLCNKYGVEYYTINTIDKLEEII